MVKTRELIASILGEWDAGECRCSAISMGVCPVLVAARTLAGSRIEHGWLYSEIAGIERAQLARLAFDFMAIGGRCQDSGATVCEKLMSAACRINDSIGKE